MSVLDSIPEPIRSMVEQAAHELYRERENEDSHGFSDSMKIARFVEELNPAQLGTLREIIQVCGLPDRQSMIYGLITGALIYKHGRNWEGKSAEEELLPDDETGNPSDASMWDHVKSEVAKDDADWGKHIESLPVDTESGPASEQQWERDLNIPAADMGKWTYQEYVNMTGIYEVKIEGGNMVCIGCGVFVHSLTDRMLLEPGVEGCKSCQKKMKWG